MEQIFSKLTAKCEKIALLVTLNANRLTPNAIDSLSHSDQVPVNRISRLRSRTGFLFLVVVGHSPIRQTALTHSLAASVTRFGKISPLLHKLKCLWQIYEGLFSICQKLLLTLVNFVYNWAIFRSSKWT